MSFFEDKNIIVTGGNGFLGSFVVENLKSKNCKNIFIPRHSNYDLTKIDDVKKMYSDFKADIVIHLAADVGGIAYNKKYPASVLYNNLMMNVLVQDEAYKAGVKKFVGIGSVCSYPKYTKIPFEEADLWNGYPEETNASYGLAKKIMLEQSKSYNLQYGFNAIHLLMINLYGPRDNFSLDNSHVVPGLIMKFSEAKKNGDKEVVVWGDGSPSREFLYVEDAAKAILLATEHYNSFEPLNIGSGFEVYIKDLVRIVSEIVKYEGNIVWDKSKPNGQPRRCLNMENTKKHLGFVPEVSLEEGLKRVYDWYVTEKVNMINL